MSSDTTASTTPSASPPSTVTGPASASTAPDAPIDFIFLVDLSSSFADDLENFVTSAPSIAAQLLSLDPNAQFAIASYSDVPEAPFGTEGDYVYRPDLALTDSAIAFQSALSQLEVASGGDLPEAQIPALIHAANGAGLGLRENSRKIILVVTDAEPHTAETYGLTDDAAILEFLDATAVSGGFPSDFPINHDMSDPFLGILCDILNINNATPIFAVTEVAEENYDAIVDEIGKGVVAPLSDNSDNLSDALSFAIANIVNNVTTTGESGTDAIGGATADDSLFGLDGDDTVSGGAGDDFVDGGSGDDTVNGGPGDDLIRGGTGDDVLNGGAGSNTLEPGLGADEVFVGTGDNAISGTASELDGTIVNGFDRGDSVVVRIANLGENDFSVTPTGDGGSILRIDANFDGLTDATLTFNTEFEKNDLTIESVGFDTIILRPFNLPPFDILLSENSVRENSAGGTVVAGLTTLDPDEDDAHTYTLEDDAGGRFVVDGNQLLVAEGASIDFETDQSHTVTLTTTDRAGASLTLDFTIEVENVNEAQVVDVARFLNAGNGAHVLTSNPAEVALIEESGLALESEGLGFRALSVADAGSIDSKGSTEVYRFYNDKLGSHFYTASATERDAILANNSAYQLEGVAFAAYQNGAAVAGLEEVFRLYNLNTGRHHWTMSEEEVAEIRDSQGWVLEGIAFYAFEKDFSFDGPDTAPSEAVTSDATQAITDIERSFDGFAALEAAELLGEDMFV
ncbi:MAG: hypothetical protein AAGJ32_12965 [Pseudomonadota bacterium]